MMAEYIFKCDNDMKNPEWKEQIVRCKDCKHFERHLEEPWDKCELHSFTIGPNDGKEPDGFCKWGERT